MEENKVICNKAGTQNICATCIHSKPHKVHYFADEKCTQLSECYLENQEYVKVKCVKLKPWQKKKF